MKILITGGCGFLGTNLAIKTLSEKDSELIIIDNLSRKGSEINLKWLRSKGSFIFFNIDVRQSGDIDKIVKGYLPDVIFHFAGQVAMTTSISDPRTDFETNVLGTINILESVRNYSSQTIVLYSSTNKVYGDLEEFEYIEQRTRYVTKEYPKGFPEDIQLSFHSPYGCSKGSADQYVLDYHRIFGLRTAVFRHSSMYGGRQFSTYDQGWIGWFCQKALETKNGTLKEAFTISGNGKQVRDVLHADDMVSLYMDAIYNIDKIVGEAFNIGGGIDNSLSLLELFEILEAEVKAKLNYRVIPWRQSDQKVFVADYSKFSRKTGWSPKVDKITGIRNMINWIIEND